MQKAVVWCRHLSCDPGPSNPYVAHQVRFVWIVSVVHSVTVCCCVTSVLPPVPPTLSWMHEREKRSEYVWNGAWKEIPISLCLQAESVLCGHLCSFPAQGWYFFFSFLFTSFLCLFTSVEGSCIELFWYIIRLETYSHVVYLGLLHTPFSHSTGDTVCYCPWCILIVQRHSSLRGYSF